ncbi:MAG: hypothetical protein IPF93_12325 [Saprospiraceae bacterium]|nr:hypothetical protein [Saprospiraceae bacterium]
MQIQLHNFNAPLSGGSLDGSAPDMFYFRQKEDGSYLLMLTSTNTNGFETDWKTEYILVSTNATGVILKTEAMKFPVTDGIIRNFDYVFDAGTPTPNLRLLLTATGLIRLPMAPITYRMIKVCSITHQTSTAIVGICFSNLILRPGKQNIFPLDPIARKLKFSRLRMGALLRLAVLVPLTTINFPRPAQWNSSSP